MLKWLVFIVLLVGVIIPFAAEAQGETKLDAINIELWSEYDEPSMLVIYQFIVSQDTPLPAEITLRFPKEGNLVAVAVEDSGQLFLKDFTPPVEQGDWQAIKIRAESYAPHRIEYYQPLRLDGNKRQFRYQWFGDYPVKQFTVALLVPADSTELITSPLLENTASEANGLITSGSVTRNDLRMGNSFQFSLEYQRTSNALISPETQIEPAAPVNEDTPGRVSIANLPWIIGLFGIALIGIALFSYWRSTQYGESEPRKRRPPKVQATTEGQGYCQECGARAYVGDRFCRTCGSRLRVE